MGRSKSKLPRVGHAAPLRPDEKLRKRGDVDLQNGWLGRHGTLSLTDDRLLFVPTILDRVLGAKRREISLDEITEIERHPKRVGDSLGGGRRTRVLVHTEQCIYELMFPDVDGWIDGLEKVYQLRAKAGRPYRPTVTREGHVNLSLVEE